MLNGFVMEVNTLSIIIYVLVPILTTVLGGWIGTYFGNKYREDKESHENLDGEKLRTVFNTTKKSHIDAMVDVAGKIISLTDVINYKICKKTGIRYKVRVAIDYRKVFAVVVGEQGHLMTGRVFSETEYRLTQSTRKLVASDFIYKNLKEDYKKFSSLSACLQQTMKQTL